jgi:hypothetical protein
MPRCKLGFFAGPCAWPSMLSLWWARKVVPPSPLLAAGGLFEQRATSLVYPSQ